MKKLKPSSAGSVASRVGKAFAPVVLGAANTIRSLSDRERQPEGAAFLVASGGTELACLLDSPRLEHVFKPLIGPSALAVALRPGRLPTVDTALLGVTAAGYTAGDVILMLSSDDPDAPSTRLARGAAAFGVGHLSLTALLVRNGVRLRPAPAASLLGPGVAIGSLLLAGKASDRPLGVYALVLSSTAALAASAGFGEFEPVADGAVTAAEGDTAARRSLGLGGAVFMASDLLILLTRGLDRSSIAGRIARSQIIDTYSLATMMLLLGGAALSRAGGAR